jgi:hypothetical protein
MSSIPRDHRNGIHPLANRAMQSCKLNLVLIAGERKSSARSPQSISFSKKENGYKASLYAKVKDPSHLSAILASINQSTELSVKIDLLCDDAEFAKLEVEKDIEVIVFALSMSFNLFVPTCFTWKYLGCYKLKCTDLDVCYKIST